MRIVFARTLDQAVAALRADGARLTGPDGFLSQLIRQVLERGLAAELTEHLGYVKHAPEGRGNLQAALKATGFEAAQLAEAGLTGTPDDGQVSPDQGSAGSKMRHPL